MNWQKKISFIFVFILGLVSIVVSESFGDKEKIINPRFFEMMDKAQEGDLIIINSDNFMSRLFKDIDGCNYSSFKIVVRSRGRKMMMVSDIEDLSDDEGFYISSVEEFFETYDQLDVSLYRFKDRGPSFYGELERLKKLSFKKLGYDFNYDFNDKKTMSCLKLAQNVYGMSSFTTENQTKFPYYSNFMCDLKLKEKFVPIITWYKFWKE